MIQLVGPGGRNHGAQARRIEQIAREQLDPLPQVLGRAE